MHKNRKLKRNNSVNFDTTNKEMFQAYLNTPKFVSLLI